MTKSELNLFSKPTFIKQPVMTWLIQDDQPTSQDGMIISALSSNGHDVEALKQQLCMSDNLYEQRKAAYALGGMGLAAVDALVYALHQDCETCQVLAAYALRKIGREAIEPLLAIVDTCPTPARQKLMWILYSVNDERVIDTLINCLNDSDRKVRCYAAWGLGHLKDKRAIPHLVEALNDRVEKMCFDAAMALVKIGGEMSGMGAMPNHNMGGMGADDAVMTDDEIALPVSIRGAPVHFS